MKRLLLVASLFVGLLILSVTDTVHAQPTGSKTPEFRLPLLYHDALITQRVAFGYDPLATVGQDTVFGEEEYPNFGGPGGGAMFFDYPGILDYGTRVDIRPRPAKDSFFIQYELQLYGSIYPGTLSWDTAAIPQAVTGITVTPKGNPSKLLVDMKRATSVNIVLDNFNYQDWEDATVTLFYNMAPVLGVHDGPHYPGLIANLSAYPNPFSVESKLTLDLTEPSNITVQAYDLTGREVGRMSQVAAGHLEIELPQLIASTGAYLLRLQATSAKGSEEKTVLVRRR
jgi:hypothetical protein